MIWHCVILKLIFLNGRNCHDMLTGTRSEIRVLCRLAKEGRCLSARGLGYQECRAGLELAHEVLPLKRGREVRQKDTRRARLKM